MVEMIEANETKHGKEKLLAKLEAAEAVRLSDAPTYTLAEARERLETIYQHG